MEPLSTQLSGRRVAMALLMGLSLSWNTGCVSSQKQTAPTITTEPSTPPLALTTEPAKTGDVVRVVTTWNNKIAYAPDTTQGGAVMPGIAGRMYLFGPDEKDPLAGDGKVIVDLYDHTPRAGKNEPKMLEEWIIDSETLKKLAKRDLFGHGYTLFLPWSSYKTDVSHIHIVARYDPLKGKSVLAQSGAMSLDHSATFQQVAAMKSKPDDRIQQVQFKP